MRDWLLVMALVVALVAWVVAVLLSPQLGSVPADLSESDELFVEALGGSTVHASSDSHPFDFFQESSGPSDAAADGSALASVAEFAAHARAYAISSFDQSSPTRAQERANR